MRKDVENQNELETAHPSTSPDTDIGGSASLAAAQDRYLKRQYRREDLVSARLVRDREVLDHIERRIRIALHPDLFEKQVARVAMAENVDKNYVHQIRYQIRNS